MRSYVPDFQIQTVDNLRSALEILSQTNSRPIAGGTDIMVMFEAGKLPKGQFLDILRIQEIRGIHVASDYIELGALTTYSEILNHPLMQSEFKMMCEAARQTGALAIQNRGTIGGNIVNASPAADTPPVLLVYDSEVQLTSLNGTRWVRYEHFHKDYKKMDILPGELLTKIRIKRNTKESIEYYHKVGTRKAQAISKVCIAGLANVSSGTVTKFRLAFGSVAATPLRCINTERAIEGQKISKSVIDKAAQILSSEITPRDDVRSTAEYRLTVSINLLKDFLGRL